MLEHNYPCLILLKVICGFSELQTEKEIGTKLDRRAHRTGNNRCFDNHQYQLYQIQACKERCPIDIWRSLNSQGRASGRGYIMTTTISTWHSFIIFGHAFAYRGVTTATLRICSFTRQGRAQKRGAGYHVGHHYLTFSHSLAKKSLDLYRILIFWGEIDT